MLLYHFEQYQNETRKLNIYPKGHLGTFAHAMGLANEAGEVLGKIKKCIRDNNSDLCDPKLKEDIKKELGDTLWYLSNLAQDFDLSLADVANSNIEKLLDRQSRGKLQGSGDDR